MKLEFLIRICRSSDLVLGTPSASDSYGDSSVCQRHCGCPNSPWMLHVTCLTGARPAGTRKYLQVSCWHNSSEEYPERLVIRCVDRRAKTAPFAPTGPAARPDQGSSLGRRGGPEKTRRTNTGASIASSTLASTSSASLLSPPHLFSSSPPAFFPSSLPILVTPSVSLSPPLVSSGPAGVSLLTVAAGFPN